LSRKTKERWIKISNQTLNEIIDLQTKRKYYTSGETDFPEIKKREKEEEIANYYIKFSGDFKTALNFYINLEPNKLSPHYKLEISKPRRKILKSSILNLLRDNKINPIKKTWILFFDLLNINKFYKKEYITTEIRKELKNSLQILNLEDNWDGEGSIGYNKKTWKKMVNFLDQIASNYYLRTQFLLSSPFINPGSKGDIDLHWKNKKFELFLSIPQSDEDPIVYYGDDYKMNAIEGSFELNDYEELLSWLKKFL